MNLNEKYILKNFDIQKERKIKSYEIVKDSTLTFKISKLVDFIEKLNHHIKNNQYNIMDDYININEDTFEFHKQIPIYEEDNEVVERLLNDLFKINEFEDVHFLKKYLIENSDEDNWNDFVKTVINNEEIETNIVKVSLFQNSTSYIILKCFNKLTNTEKFLKIKSSFSKFCENWDETKFVEKKEKTIIETYFE